MSEDIFTRESQAAIVNFDIRYTYLGFSQLTIFGVSDMNGTNCVLHFYP